MARNTFGSQMNDARKTFKIKKSKFKSKIAFLKPFLKTKIAHFVYNELLKVNL